MKYKYIPIIFLGFFLQCTPNVVKQINSEYGVSRIIDGDTIVLDNNERVRLIGINAPELKERCGIESKKKLEELIDDKIIMEKDISERDRYNRLLRYVYVNDKHMNLEMIKTGYATSWPYPPDIKYKKEFNKAQKDAEKNNAGCLWK